MGLNWFEWNPTIYNEIQFDSNGHQLDRMKLYFIEWNPTIDGMEFNYWKAQLK